MANHTVQVLTILSQTTHAVGQGLVNSHTHTAAHECTCQRMHRQSVQTVYNSGKVQKIQRMGKLGLEDVKLRSSVIIYKDIAQCTKHLQFSNNNIQGKMLHTFNISIIAVSLCFGVKHAPNSEFGGGKPRTHTTATVKAIP